MVAVICLPKWPLYNVIDRFIYIAPISMETLFAKTSVWAK